MAEIPCRHFAIERVVHAHSTGCEDCLKIGGRWVHLRLCLDCGHVGCCDDSPNRHATKHAHATSHPTIASFERGEHWGWCYPHEHFEEQLPASIQVIRSGR